MAKDGSYTQCLLAQKDKRITAWVPTAEASNGAKIEIFDGVASRRRNTWTIVDNAGLEAPRDMVRMMVRDVKTVGMVPVSRRLLSIRLPAGAGRRPIIRPSLRKAGIAAVIAALASSCTLTGAPAIAHQPAFVQVAP